MPMIRLNKRSHIPSPLAEDIRINSLRDRLLSLFKRTDDFYRNDNFSTHLSAGLLSDWTSFRNDCDSVSLIRFRVLHRLRLQSWKETADEQVIKLSSLSNAITG